MRRRRFGRAGMLLIVTVALLLSLGLTASVAGANGASPLILMSVCLDGSGSIDAAEWNTFVTGLADAVENQVPQNGSIELSVVQFAGDIPGYARVEVSPTVIDSAATATLVANQIKAIIQGGGLTPMAAGIDLARDQIVNSAYFNTSTWHVINISTDGVPNVPDEGALAAELAIANAVAAGIDEVDAEAVGTGADTTWMVTKLVYPLVGSPPSGALVPPDSYPPRPPNPDFSGFVRVCDTWADYAEAIDEKFEEIIPDIILEPVTDTNPVNTSHTLTATYTLNGGPVSGEQLFFEVTSGPHAGTKGTATTDGSGQATWSYTGTSDGPDTIYASTTDYPNSGSAGVISNAAEKDWEEEPRPPTVPSVTTWGIIAAITALGGLVVVTTARKRCEEVIKS